MRCLFKWIWAVFGQENDVSLGKIRFFDFFNNGLKQYWPFEFSDLIGHDAFVACLSEIEVRGKENCAFQRSSLGFNEFQPGQCIHMRDESDWTTKLNKDR